MVLVRIHQGNTGNHQGNIEPIVLPRRSDQDENQARIGHPLVTNRGYSNRSHLEITAWLPLSRTMCPWWSPSNTVDFKDTMEFQSESHFNDY